MAFFNQEFVDDGEEIEQKNFELMPPHDAELEIIEADYKRNGKDTGDIMPLTFEIKDGPHVGRKVWSNVTMAMDAAGSDEKATKAAKIGEETFKLILRAIGKISARQTEDLLGCRLRGSIYVKPASGQYGPKNDVRNFKSVSAGQSSQNFAPNAAQQAAKPAAKPAASGGAPWKKAANG